MDSTSGEDREGPPLLYGQSRLPIAIAGIPVTAFQRFRRVEARFEDAIPWSAIATGFDFSGENVLLANRALGIFRPRQVSRGALSVKTTVPPAWRERRYDDIASEGNPL